MKYLKLFEGYNRISYEFGKSLKGGLVNRTEMIAKAVAGRLPLGQLSDDTVCMASLIKEITDRIGKDVDTDAIQLINSIIQDNKYMQDLYDTIVTSAASGKVMAMKDVLALPPKPQKSV